MIKTDKQLYAIVVVDKNWHIGYRGNLLAHLPGDLRYFKEKTMGKTLVVGRKTLESFPGGKPLPGRETIVLTRNRTFSCMGCTICYSKEEVLERTKGKAAFIAGGEEIYRLFLEDCHTYYVTKMHDSFQADCAFPNLDRRDDMKIQWESPVQEEPVHRQGKEEKVNLQYQFLQYERIR